MAITYSRSVERKCGNDQFMFAISANLLELLLHGGNITQFTLG